MSFWWHVRQWVYARPPLAAAGAVVLLLIVGFGGWESARQLSNHAPQTAKTALQRVTVTTILRIKGKNGRVINHVVRRTRTLHGVTIKAKPRVIPSTVTDVLTQKVVKSRTLTRLINHPQTVTEIRTQQVQVEDRNGQPPGHNRPTTTVTVTRTQTVTQPAVTVTVTTSKGH
jgi:hypothetical protein